MADSSSQHGDSLVDPSYPHLVASFLQAMEEIGMYGEQKYGDRSFLREAVQSGNRLRLEARKETHAICAHAKAHADLYEQGIPHDYFRTRRHQLAAVAFNAMMEFWYAELDKEGTNAQA